MTKTEKYLQEAVMWIRANQERFWATVGASILAVLFIGLLIHHRQTESEAAWTQLGNIQGTLMQGKFDETRKALDTWETRFKTTDADTYERFMKADLLYNTSNYAQAANVYADLAATGEPAVVRPLALSAEASSEEMAGQIPKALNTLQTFTDQYPDHFLAAPRYLAQARLLQMSGNEAGAAAVYERYILLFPQTPWTDFARRQSQALSKK